MVAISPEVASRMIEHLRNNTTDMAESDLRVPIACFTDDAHARAEVALLRRLPLIAAHRAELAQPGSFITRELLGVPLLIVRQTDGTAAAFLNMCRHRGGKVESAASGSKRLFVCRYHGWSYERDGGTLRHVPFESGFEPIDKRCSGLVRVRTEERHGFVWVTLDGEAAAPVADFLGPRADAQLAAFGLDEAVVFLDKSFTMDLNWKLAMDGAIDILHPLFLHPEGVGKLFQTNAGVWEDYGRHGQLFTARRRLTELVKAGEKVEAAWKYFATNLLLYPNAMAIAAPDHIEFWTVWPDPQRAGRSTTNIRFLVPQAKLDEEMAARLNQSWEILGHAAQNEDWPMEESIQRNAEANPGGSYLYGRSEISCQHLHRRLQADLATMAHAAGTAHGRL
jgi:phenylpropionate dioxygenase-like ring-hydroxylating dioxygenase large terminal subunit